MAIKVFNNALDSDNLGFCSFERDFKNGNWCKNGKFFMSFVSGYFLVKGGGFKRPENFEYSIYFLISADRKNLNMTPVYPLTMILFINASKVPPIISVPWMKFDIICVDI